MRVARVEALRTTKRGRRPSGKHVQRRPNTFNPRFLEETVKTKLALNLAGMCSGDMRRQPVFVHLKPMRRHGALPSGGLYNRAEHAERAARHWQSLWEDSFRNLGSMLLA